MNLDARPRFQSERINDLEWVVHDLAYDEGDSRRVIARIWQADPDEYEVTWVRDLPLNRWYHSIRAVLDDVIALTPKGSRPIPIPHRPPATARLAATA